MEHQVPEEIKTKRSAQLLALAESMSREFRAYYVGKEEEVLFEEPMEVDGETWYTGYTKEYVKIAAKTAEPLDNVMKRGRVEAALTDEIYRMKLWRLYFSSISYTIDGTGLVGMNKGRDGEYGEFK